MLNYRTRAATTAATLLILNSTASYSATIGGDLSTLSTIDQNMFGAVTGAIGFQPQDLTIIDTGILDTEVIGEVKNVANTVALRAHDGLVAARNAGLGACNVLIFAAAIAECQALVPGVPPRPPATVKDGTQLTISNVGVSYGFGTEFNLGEGKVSAAQDFQSEFTVDKDTFTAGDVLTIGTDVTLGSSSISSELGGLDGKIEQVLSVSGKLELENYVLGLKTIDSTIFDEDHNGVRDTLLGFELDDQTASITGLGLTLPIDIENGVSKTFSVPIAPMSPIKIPVADATLFAPDLDIDNAVGFSNIGSPVGLPAGVSTSVKADGNRTGNGVLPPDFARLDVDADAITAANGLPLGARAEFPSTFPLPDIANIELNLLDLDVGAIFSLGQEQSFKTEEIFVTLNFNAPTEVETFEGSGVFKTVTTKTVVLGTDVKIKHPGGDLQVTPEYSIGSNIYSNRTQITLSPVATLALAQLKIGGALGALLPENNFSIFEDTFELGDTFEIADIFNDAFDLGNFNTQVGSTFSLNASTISVSAVPVPMSLPLLAGGLGLLGCVGRRNKKARS